MSLRNFNPETTPIVVTGDNNEVRIVIGTSPHIIEVENPTIDEQLIIESFEGRYVGWITSAEGFEGKVIRPLLRRKDKPSTIEQIRSSVIRSYGSTEAARLDAQRLVNDYAAGELEDYDDDLIARAIKYVIRYYKGHGWLSYLPEGIGLTKVGRVMREIALSRSSRKVIIR